MSTEPEGDEPEESELARAASWLEKITRDPMADAVAGRVTIVSASAPQGRRRYQECDVELIAEAPGIPPTTVRQQVVFGRSLWPRAGYVLPARISRTHPEVLEVAWEAMRELDRRR